MFGNESGPVVRVVVLKTDGTITETPVDMNPSTRPMERVLGGAITLNGQYLDDLVVIVIRQEASTRNQHVLPPPFHQDRIYGDICLVRMDEDAEPRDYTKREYLELLQGHRVTRNSVYRVRSHSI